MAVALRESNELPLAVVGCDFRLASSQWRSRLVLSDEEREELVSQLRRSASVDGFADLNTCNRTEWIVTARNPMWAAQLLGAQMIDRFGDQGHHIRPAIWVGEDAARYLFSVSIGRRSFVKGERQIASQVFDALESARARGHSCRLLNGLGKVIGRLVRDAQDVGCVGTACRGVHSLAVHHVKDWLQRRGRGGDRVAVVGMGSIGRRVRGLLEQDPDLRVIPVNRTVAADGRDAVRPLHELPAILAEVDAAIVCTSAPSPVVTGQTLSSRESDVPLLVLDLGIPEQVQRMDPALGGIREGLDDLKDDAPRNQTREHDGRVERLVCRAVEEFVIFAREDQVADVMDAVRRRHDRFIHKELGRLFQDHLRDLDEAQRARVEFELRGMVLGYTRDIFGAIKSSLADEEPSQPSVEIPLSCACDA